MVPLNRTTRLDIVPVDFVARSILYLSSNKKSPGKCFHIAAGPEGDMRLIDMLQLIAQEFKKRAYSINPGIWKSLGRPLLRTLSPQFFRKIHNLFSTFEAYIWEENPRFSNKLIQQAFLGSNIYIPKTEEIIKTFISHIRLAKI